MSPGCYTEDGNIAPSFPYEIKRELIFLPIVVGLRKYSILANWGFFLFMKIMVVVF